LYRGGVARNCLIINNSSTMFPGGGVTMMDDSYGGAVLQNCTVVGNSASANCGGGISTLISAAGWGGGIVQNCIVQGNTGTKDIVTAWNVLRIEYSCIGTIGGNYVPGQATSAALRSLRMQSSGTIARSLVLRLLTPEKHCPPSLTISPATRGRSRYGV